MTTGDLCRYVGFCPRCGTEVEVLRRDTEERLVEGPLCPACSALATVVEDEVPRTPVVASLFVVLESLRPLPDDAQRRVLAGVRILLGMDR